MLAAPLPAPANATIGREGELAEIGALLVRPEVRLLTLVGTGGVGKTRLALEAARALARPLPRRRRVRRPRGATTPARSCPPRRPRSASSPTTPAELGERLARATRGASALLVLDGFERFLADAAQVAQLLAAVPNLTVLATSRAPLRLTAEHAYRVQPLAASNAAALFTARVAASRPDWAPTTTSRRRGDLRAPGRAAARDRAGRRPRAAAAAAGAAGAPRAAGWSC